MYGTAVVLSDWTKMRFSVKVQQRDLKPNSKAFNLRQFIWMVCFSIPQSPPVEVFPQTALETSVVMVALADSFGWGKDVIYPPSQSFLRRRRQGHTGIKVLLAFTEGINVFFFFFYALSACNAFQQIPLETRKPGTCATRRIVTSFWWSRSDLHAFSLSEGDCHVETV